MSDTHTVQTEKGRSVIEAVPVLHPFLLAVYPVLGLYAFNQELTLISATFRPGLTLLAAALVLWLALGAIFKNSYKAGLVASLIIVATTSGWNVLEYAMASFLTNISGRSAIIYYLAFGLVALAAGAVAVWYSKSSTWDRIRLGTLIIVVAAALLFLGDLILAPIFQRGPAWAMLLYALIVCGLIFALQRWQGDMRRTTRTLNIFGFILLGLSVANIVLNRTTNPVTPPLPPITNTAAAVTPPEMPLPDIWFIALDGYARPDALAGLYAYNAQPFITALEERGFNCLSASSANYAAPLEALASCLNMEYLDELHDSDEPLHMTTLAEWYHQNRVTAHLQNMGYQTFASAPPHEILKPRGKVDQIIQNPLLPSEFELVLIESSALARIIQATHYIRHRSLAELRHIVARMEIEGKLDRMYKIAAEPHAAPRFIKAYFPIPNAPFLFDRKGEWPESAGLYSYGGRALFRGGMQEYQQRYTDQVHWLNTQLLELVDAIQDNAATPPIILLVSLQGAAGPPGASRELQEVILAQHFLNFTALNLPGKPDIPDDLSPVNLFRVALDGVMHFDPPLLDNRRHLSLGAGPLSIETTP